MLLFIEVESAPSLFIGRAEEGKSAESVYSLFIRRAGEK
jgi:hypothetical protein